MNSARTARRLEIARGLEHLPKKFDMRWHIKMLQPERRNRLRLLVDWVEQYEAHQQPLNDAMVKQVQLRLERKRQLSL